MKFALCVVLFVTCCLLHYAACHPAYCGTGNSNFEYKAVPKDEGTLKQVLVAMRHGDRILVNASKCWNNDVAVWDCLLTEAITPTLNRDQHYLRVERLYRKVFDTGREELPGNCALGQLTSIGFKQDLTLGEKFKALYVDSGFLSPNFTSQEHFIRSSDVYRTMQSVQMFMTGMFPPSQPVEGRAGIMDINTMDLPFDDIIPNANLCPKLKVYEQALFKTPMFISHYMNVSLPLVEDIKKALGEENFQYVDIYHLFDCLMVHLCHDVEIPSGITPELLDRITKEMEYLVYSIYNYPSHQDVSRVGIGFLVKEMYQAIVASILGESAHKFLLYSGHDATIMSLLAAFNISDQTWAPYGSFIIVEVYQLTDTTHGIRMLYNNGTPLKLPFCNNKEMCGQDDFTRYLDTIMPFDPKTECLYSA